MAKWRSARLPPKFPLGWRVTKHVLVAQSVLFLDIERCARRWFGVMAAQTRLTVLVCRGCCCGTTRKHPDVDHDGQIASLRETAERVGARLQATDCLGPCERSNVVLLRTRAGGTTSTIWLGGVLTPEQTSALAEWISTRPEETSSLPPELAGLAFQPTAEDEHGLKAVDSL